LFSGFVWILKLAVRTNWPTVAEKPDRKALNGYNPPHTQRLSVSIQTFSSSSSLNTKYPLPSLTERNRILEGRRDETSIVWRVGIDWGFGTTNVTAPDDTIRKLQHAHRDEKGHEDVD